MPPSPIDLPDPQEEEPPFSLREQSPPPPPTPPPPLELEYNSDESESDYKFTHTINDPPTLWLAYLNALADHIIQKTPVRDAEANLRSSHTHLFLTHSWRYL